METKKKKKHIIDIANVVNEANMYSVMADTIPGLYNCGRVDSSAKLPERIIELVEKIDNTGKGTAQNICDDLRDGLQEQYLYGRFGCSLKESFLFCMKYLQIRLSIKKKKKTRVLWP